MLILLTAAISAVSARHDEASYQEILDDEKDDWERIEKALRESGRPMTVQELAALVQESAFHTGRLLVRMERRGKVVRQAGRYQLRTPE
jgi:Ni/Co efflux regulator RcnB